MKTSPSWSGDMPHGEFQGRNQKKTPPGKTKRFDSFVARYYPAAYSFARRFTDDPLEAGVLTRDAFNTTRKQLQTCCDENVLASILISNVIRAGLPLQSNSTQTERRNNHFVQRYGTHGTTVTGSFRAGACDYGSSFLHLQTMRTYAVHSR